MRSNRCLKVVSWIFAIIVPAALCVSGTLAASDDEKHFLDANEQAMKTMMSGMHIHATGDVDADFAALMIPHHQGAIDMAKAELQYGTNKALRRIAQEIIVDQDQEITAMRLAVSNAQKQ